MKNPLVDEIAALDMQLAGMHQRTPYAIQHVSKGQLSIARHYGGIKYQGDAYTYFAESDELVRDDVLVYIRKSGKVTAKADKEIKRLEREKWMALQQELLA